MFQYIKLYLPINCLLNCMLCWQTSVKTCAALVQAMHASKTNSDICLNAISGKNSNITVNMITDGGRNNSQYRYTNSIMSCAPGVCSRPCLRIGARVSRGRSRSLERVCATRRRVQVISVKHAALLEV